MFLVKMSSCSMPDIAVGLAGRPSVAYWEVGCYRYLRAREIIPVANGSDGSLANAFRTPVSCHPDRRHDDLDGRGGVFP